MGNPVRLRPSYNNQVMRARNRTWQLLAANSAVGATLGPSDCIVPSGRGPTLGEVQAIPQGNWVQPGPVRIDVFSDRDDISLDPIPQCSLSIYARGASPQTRTYHFDDCGFTVSSVNVPGSRRHIPLEFADASLIVQTVQLETLDPNLLVFDYDPDWILAPRPSNHQLQQVPAVKVDLIWVPSELQHQDHPIWDTELRALVLAAQWIRLPT